MNPAQPETKYYTVKQAADIVQVSTHTLRLWEKLGKVSPTRNEKNHRVYTQEQVEKLSRLKEGKMKEVDVAKKTKNFWQNVTKVYAVTTILTLGFFGYLLLTVETTDYAKIAKKEVKTASDRANELLEKGHVLGTRDTEADYALGINVPLRIGSTVVIDQSLSQGGSSSGVLGISTPALNLINSGGINGLASIDATTRNTLENSLPLGGDVSGFLRDVSINDNVIDDAHIVNNLDYSGVLNIAGEWEIDGDEVTVTADEINALDGGIDADELEGNDASSFLRSNTSDAFTSGTLSFSNTTFLDLSSITHATSAAQGFRLPQATTFVAPTTGEGYIAYDTDDDKIVYFNGSAWTDISTSTTLQNAYDFGSTIQLSDTSGDLRIYSDGGSELLFLDENNGYIGLGTTAPSAKLAIGGNALLGTGTSVNTLTLNKSGSANSSNTTYNSSKLALLASSYQSTQYTESFIHASEGPYNYGADITLDSNGYPVVVGGDVYDDDLVFVHCDDANCTGDTVTNLVSTGNVGSSPSVVVDSNDYPMIAYYDSGNSDLEYIHCNDINCSGGDDTPIVLNGNTVGDEYGGDIELDSNGYPTISFYQSPNYYLGIIECNDADCSTYSTNYINTGDVGAYHDLELDSNGYPVISSYDWDNDQLILTHCNDTACAGGDDLPVVVDSQTGAGNYRTALELDSNGYPMIAYIVNKSFDEIWYVHCNDANCAGGDETPVRITEPNVDRVSDYVDMKLTSAGIPVIAANVRIGADSYQAAAYTCSDTTCTSTTVIRPHLDNGGTSSTGQSVCLALDSSDNPVMAADYNSISGFVVYSASSPAGTYNRQLSLQNIINSPSDYRLSVLGNSNTELFVIDESGNIGIGTTNPQYSLQVTGNAAIDNLSMDGNILAATNNSGVSIYDNANNGLFVKDGGNIGIGTTLPLEKLDVRGRLYLGDTTAPGTTTNRMYSVSGDLYWAGTKISDPSYKGTTLIVAASNAANTANADYVATGTNDQLTIETAIAALPSTGGRVLLTDGTFDISASGIDITKSNVTLEGQGRSTILRKTANSSSIDGMITVGDGGTTAVSGVEIRNLTLNGRKSIYTSTNNYGIYFNYKVTDSKIINTYIYDLYYGINLYGYNGSSNNLWDIVVQDNTIENITAYGIYAFSSNNLGLNRVTIKNNMLIGGGNNSIQTSWCNDCVIEGNNIQTGVGYGMLIGNSFANVITDNIVAGATKDGIYMTGGDHNTIVGNNIDTWGANYDAINLYSVDNTNVTGNTIYSGSTLTGSYGINIWSNSIGNYIAGNNVYGWSYAGDIANASTTTTIQQDNQMEINSNGQIALKVVQSGSADIVNIFDSSTEVFTIEDGGNIGIGNINPDAYLDIKANTTGTAQISLTSSSGTNVSSPNDGDLWYNGTNLYFYDGSSNTDLLSSGGGAASATLVVAASNSNDTSTADYVADGTDDDATIETAIAALPSTGGKIVLLDGTFNIGNTIGDGIDLTKSNVVIEGQGKSTILKRMGNTAVIDGIITVGNNGSTTVTNAEIRDLQIDGNDATYSSIYNTGIYFYLDVNNSTVENVYVHDTAYGIWVRGSSTQQSKYNRIINNQLGNTTNDSIMISSNDANALDGTIVSGNTILNSSTESLSLDNCDNCSITSNTIDGGTYGAIIQRTTYATFSNNTIRNSSTAGLRLISSSLNNTISGNTFEEITNATQSMISVETSSTDNLITGNNFYDSSSTSTYGIKFASTANNNYASGNKASGAGIVGTVSDAATGNTVVQQHDVFEINTNGNLALAITSDGLLGIGTTDPNSGLHLANSGWTDIVIEDPSSGEQFWVGHDGSDAYLDSSGSSDLYMVGGSTASARTEILASSVNGATIKRYGTGTTDLLHVLDNTTEVFTIKDGGYVGIGTTDPWGFLHVAGSGSAEIIFEDSDTGDSFWIGTDGSNAYLDPTGSYDLVMSGGSVSASRTQITASSTNGATIKRFGTGTSSIFHVLDDTTEVLTIEDGGNVGIGTTNPAHAIDVVGTAGLSTGTAWTNTSDERFKNEQEELLGKGLDTIMQLRPISFEWNELHSSRYGEDPGLNYGFIAQEVEEVIPEFITQDDEGYYFYNPSGMEALLTAAIQEQQAELDMINELLGLTVTGESSNSENTVESTPLAGISTMVEEMLKVYEEFKSFAESLGFTKTTDDEGNDLLAIESDLTVTGSTTLSDLKITGTLTAGLIEIDTITNEVNVLGASCYNDETESHNEDLCELQALNIQTEKSGNVNFFDNEVIIEPNGTLTAKEVRLDTLTITNNETAGADILEAGNTKLVIETTQVKEDSLIFVTPQDDTKEAQLYVSDRSEKESFTVKLTKEIDKDIEFNWIIIQTN